MKIFKSIIVVVIIILISYLFFTTQPDEDKNNLQKFSEQKELATYTDQVLGISFVYDGSSNGYTIIEVSPRDGDAEDFVKKLIIMKTSDYELIKDSPGQGGPPTFNVTAFTRSTSSLEEWLTERQYFTNFEAINALPVTIDTEQGIQYLWEGMFSGKNYRSNTQ